MVDIFLCRSLLWEMEQKDQQEAANCFHYIEFRMTITANMYMQSNTLSLRMQVLVKIFQNRKLLTNA